jgi:hypothetical protein
MNKIDFKKVKVETIDKSTVEMDLSKMIGNIMYQRSPNYDLFEIGKTIWEKGEIELSKEQIDLVSKFIDSIPEITYLMKVSILSSLKY